MSDLPTDFSLDTAVQELGIDVPVYAARVVGGRVELHLYGGGVAYLPLKAPYHAPKLTRAKTPSVPAAEATP